MEPFHKVYQTIKEHPYILVCYFSMRVFTFGLLMSFFGVKFGVSVLDHLDQPFVGRFILLPLAVLGMYAWKTRNLHATLLFTGGFFVWNAFLISLFVRHSKYDYIGLYAFMVDIGFSVYAMRRIWGRKLRKSAVRQSLLQKL
jgi:hypothetical protein